MRFFKKGWLLAILACALMVGSALAAPKAAPKTAVKKDTSAGKVALVNGSAIQQKELEAALRQIRQAMQSQGRAITDEQAAEIRKDVLEDLIRRELLFQASQKKGVQVDAALIDDEVKKLKAQFPAEADYQKALAEMHVTEAEVRGQIKEGLAIQKFVQNEFVPQATVSDGEAQLFYDQNPQYFVQPEQVRASHILVKFDTAAGETGKDEAKKKMAMIQEKLGKGEAFDALAQTYSDDPSKAKGGDLGFFRRNMMVKPFEEAAFALKPGDVSGVVETVFGYHLIKMAEKKPETTIAFQDVKERIVRNLSQERVREKVTAFLDQAKKSAKIERFLK